MTGGQSLSQAAYNADGLSIVLLTVAMDPKTMAAVKGAVSRKHWTVTYSEHKDYICSNRRPAFGVGSNPLSQLAAFVNFDDSMEEATEAAQYLQRSFAGQITIIAVGASLNPDLVLAAMRSGCSEFLSDDGPEALPDLLDRLEMRWMHSQTFEALPQGAILSLFGTKGGVGTTTLAVHLAMFLVQCHKKRTLLIDHHSELGHVCVYLGMDGGQCQFNQLVRNFNRLDSELLRGFVGHHPSGLDVLSSPDVSGTGMPMNLEALTRTLAFLRSEYDYVVIDSAPPVAASGLAALEASSQIFLVVTPEIGAVRDLSRYIDRLAPNDSFTDKLRVVLNRAESQHALHPSQIEKAVKLPVNYQMPDCYADLVRSENLGEPISPQSKSELALAIIKWTDSIVGAPSRIKSQQKTAGLLSSLKQGLLPRVAVTRAQ